MNIVSDIDYVIQNFHKRQLKGSFVKATRVKVADSILVQNLKPGSTEQGIELYFESTKNSGGDSVREVRLLSEKNKAVVFFENWKGMHVGRFLKMLEKIIFWW